MRFLTPEITGVRFFGNKRLAGQRLMNRMKINRQEIPRSYQNAVNRLNIYCMTSNEIYQVAEAAHQLPNLYRAAIIKENSISATTFSRWIKAKKNTPIFLKSGISLAVEMVLEVVKPIEKHLVVIPDIPNPPLSRQRPLFYTYHLLMELGRSVHTAFCKELDYSLASYSSMKNREFDNLSGVELRGFKMILIRAFTELLTQVVAVAKLVGVPYKHLPHQIGSGVKI